MHACCRCMLQVSLCTTHEGWGSFVSMVSLHACLQVPAAIGCCPCAVYPTAGPHGTADGQCPLWLPAAATALRPGRAALRARVPAAGVPTRVCQSTCARTDREALTSVLGSATVHACLSSMECRNARLLPCRDFYQPQGYGYADQPQGYGYNAQFQQPGNDQQRAGEYMEREGSQEQQPQHYPPSYPPVTGYPAVPGEYTIPEKGESSGQYYRE